MKLGTWLKDNNHTHNTFVNYAYEKGASFSIHALAKWCRGVRIPRKEEMQIIYDLTDGNVTPNDFYNLKPK